MDSLALQEEIFSTALQLEAEQRTKYLDQACADDPALRETVEKLIEAHIGETKILDRESLLGNEPQALAQLLDGAAKEVMTSAEGDASEKEKSLGEYGYRPGDVIGCYKLLEEIGEGGMGVVFMAEQMAPVRRKVALKIVKLGMDTRNIIARFEAERQALAMMDHTSITRVLDAGTTKTGRPYFVMELVRGRSIKHYCYQNRLSVRERVQLFVEVCQAVQHAHQKGVIHRDIKPSNILIASQDGRPTPKIIDFGIAKATNRRLTDKTLFTRFGDMIGTVDYMSPEQAELSGVDIDTRSDIYSLGVVLYELLTGTTPLRNLQKLGLQKISETIRTSEPERPSTRVAALDETSEEIYQQWGVDASALSRTLRGDLDWIILRCLEKDRQRRYETAADLARDLQRFLDGEPVEAAAPSTWYRARKFYQRHQLPIIAATFMSLLLIAASIFCVNMAIASYHDAKRAKEAEAKARKAENLAEQRLKELQALTEEREKQFTLHIDMQTNQMAVQVAREQMVQDYLHNILQSMEGGGPQALDHVNLEAIILQPERLQEIERSLVAAPMGTIAFNGANNLTAAATAPQLSGPVEWADVYSMPTAPAAIEWGETSEDVAQSFSVEVEAAVDELRAKGIIIADNFYIPIVPPVPAGPDYMVPAEAVPHFPEPNIDDMVYFLDLTLQEQRKNLGEQHAFLLPSLMLLAECFINQEEWEKAESKLQECLDIIEVAQAEHDALFATYFVELPARTKLMFAFVAKRQGKDQFAEEMMEQAEADFANLSYPSVDLQAVAGAARRQFELPAHTP